MPRVNNEVIIHAPVEKVFHYVSQPANLQQIWPSLVEVTNEELLPNGGYRYRWKYKMSGIQFSGFGEAIDFKRNVLLISRNVGAIESVVTFAFMSKDIQTKVTLGIDYRVPLLLLGKFTETIILKMNEKEAELILDNLRIIFEKS
jgi:uncharacterized protein YndB with AHSA1/START domain